MRMSIKLAYLRNLITAFITGTVAHTRQFSFRRNTILLGRTNALIRRYHALLRRYHALII